jgi:hypothetical protein
LTEKATWIDINFHIRAHDNPEHVCCYEHCKFLPH